MGRSLDLILTGLRASFDDSPDKNEANTDKQPKQDRHPV
jgi:hypothetical protein